MDQNQDIDSDLQKAIDDITNTEKEEPVFTDPVAAPSSVPENGEDTMSDPVGPFEETPIAPMPELGIPPMPESSDAMEPMPEFTMPEEAPKETVKEPGDLGDVKGDALKSLIPLLDKLTLDPAKKFDLCKLAFEEFHDSAMLKQALTAANGIADETAKAEALLYIVEAN